MLRTVLPQACRCDTALLSVLKMLAVLRHSLGMLPGTSPIHNSDLRQALRQAANSQSAA